MSRKRIAHPRWNVRHLFLLVPWVGLGLAAFHPIRDNSFLWHIKAGVVQAHQGRVLTTDPFSFSFHGDPWRTQSWVVELGYSWLYRHFEFRFVALWIVLLGGVLLLSIGIVVFRRSQSVLPTASVLIGISWMGLAYLAPRPVIVSFVALALLILVTDNRTLGWSTPLIIWIWSAAHGSFIVGIGYLVLQALRTRDRRVLKQASFGAVLSSLTAHGYHVWSILWSFLMNRAALEVIQEWAPPQITHLVTWPYAVAMTLIMVGLARRWISQRDLWVIVPFLLFGLTSQRALFLASIVIAPWVLSPGAPMRRGPESSMPSILIGGIGVALALLPFVLSPPTGSLDETVFPIEAAKHLTQDRVFHDDVAGGYLIVAEGDRLVLVDDRAELYGREHFDEVTKARQGRPVWRGLFAAQDLSQALLGTNDGLVGVLVQEGWIETFRDDDFVVLTSP